MKYGQVGNKHDVVHPNYQTWGLAGTKEVHPLAQSNAPADIIKLIQNNGIDISGYQLSYANTIRYYQGIFGDKAATLLRFQRSDDQNNILGGEHITCIFDAETKQLLGYTRMRGELTPNVADLTHQQALKTALTFLTRVAPDLIPAATNLPELNTLEKHERMEFSPGLHLGNVEIQWMDDHPELLTLNRQKTEIHGMKIKMYIPKYKLWAWVIVGCDNQVLTFERNISWDFDAMIRQTQMWLHDDWLKTQDIVLSPTVFHLHNISN